MEKKEIMPERRKRWYVCVAFGYTLHFCSFHSLLLPGPTLHGLQHADLTHILHIHMPAWHGLEFGTWDRKDMNSSALLYAALLKAGEMTVWWDMGWAGKDGRWREGGRRRARRMEVEAGTGVGGGLVGVTGPLPWLGGARQPERHLLPSLPSYLSHSPPT